MAAAYDEVLDGLHERLRRLRAARVEVQLGGHGEKPLERAERRAARHLGRQAQRERMACNEAIGAVCRALTPGGADLSAPPSARARAVQWAAQTEGAT